MKVFWTETADGHLDAIHAYISEDSETYALRILDRITTRSQLSGELPVSGKAEKGTRPPFEMKLALRARKGI